MSNFFAIEPEVAGGFGKETTGDMAAHPPVIDHLHYEFDGWMGDDLLESFPCFIVTASLAQELERCHLTGFEFSAVMVTPSPKFTALYPKRVLPNFRRLVVRGRPGADDFGLTSDCRLIVSENALAAMQKFSMKAGKVQRWAV